MLIYIRCHFVRRKMVLFLMQRGFFFFSFFIGEHFVFNSLSNPSVCYLFVKLMFCKLLAFLLPDIHDQT